MYIIVAIYLTHFRGENLPDDSTQKVMFPPIMIRYRLASTTGDTSVDVYVALSSGGTIATIRV